MFKKNNLKKINLTTVQKYFEMQDFNKKAKLNAFSQEQLAMANIFATKINETIEKLCIPDYQN